MSTKRISKELNDLAKYVFFCQLFAHIHEIFVSEKNFFLCFEDLYGLHMKLWKKKSLINSTLPISLSPSSVVRINVGGVALLNALFLTYK